MIDHLSHGVADLDRALAFYDAALGGLGHVRVWSHERGAGYGPPGAVDEPFAIHAAGTAARAPGAGCHLAFAAADRAAVDAFHAGAVAAGGTDDGPPGLRPRYGEGYYAAFVIDPDGYRLEAVCHEAI